MDPPRPGTRSDETAKASGRPKTPWAFGPRVSRGSIVSTAIGFAVATAIAIYSESYLVMAVVFVPPAIGLLRGLIRGKSLVPMVTGGEDTSDSYRVEDGRVTVEKDGKTWTRPLSSYEGVLWREKEESFRRSSTTYQVLDLRHGENRAFDVNLHTSLQVAGMRERWEAAARAFDLPALRDLGDGQIQRREPGDLDKSLRELAREEGWDSSFGGDDPPPPGVRWARLGEGLEIRLRKAIAPCLVFALPFVIFILLVVHGIETVDLLYRAMALAPVALLYGLWIRIDYLIFVTPRSVSVGYRLGPVPLWRRSLGLDEIEEIQIRPGVLVWPSVLLESDSATLSVRLLSETSAQWLVRFLRSAIATAPPEAGGDERGSR